MLKIGRTADLAKELRIKLEQIIKKSTNDDLKSVLSYISKKIYKKNGSSELA